MKVTDRCIDDKGVVHERTLEIDCITEAEALLLDARQAVVEHNADIERQLAEDAVASFDDMLSGDKDKIAAIKKRRNELRAQLK